MVVVEGRINAVIEEIVEDEACVVGVEVVEEEAAAVVVEVEVEEEGLERIMKNCRVSQLLSAYRRYAVMSASALSRCMTVQQDSVVGRF